MSFTNIYEAAEWGTVKDVKYFIEEKEVNVNTKGGHNGETPLHTAAWYGKVEVAEYLISKGADINAKDRDGATPLFSAATDTGHAEHDPGKLNVAKLLVSKGADVNAIIYFGSGRLRPLDLAKRTELQNYLKSAGGKTAETSGGGGGCYVATCIYNSYDCPEVWTLRRYRDSKLSSSWFGRRFIRIYYAVSPKVVKLFGNKKWFHRIWKPVLNKIVRTLQNNGIESDSYSDMKHQ